MMSNQPYHHHHHCDNNCCCCWVASVVSDSVRPHRRQPTRLRRPWDSPGKNAGVGCHFLLQCMKGKVKVKSLSGVWLLATPWTAAHQAPQSMGFSRQEYWSDCQTGQNCVPKGVFINFATRWQVATRLHICHKIKWKWSRSVASDS